MPNFVNPYTFIGLSDQACRSVGECSAHPGDLTGILHCTLEPLTPLFIPNAANKHAFPDIERQHIEEWNNANPENQLTEAKDIDDVTSYDFYSYDDPQGDRTGAYSRPIIPGSSIKGIIRSAYETVTDSCMSTVDMDMELHRRSPIAYNRKRSTTQTGVGIVKNGRLIAGKKAVLPSDAPWHSPAGFPIIPNRDSLPRWSKINVSFNGTYGYNEDSVVSSVNAATDTTPAYFLPGEQFGTGKTKHFDTVIYDLQGSGHSLPDDSIRRIKKLSARYSGYKGWIDAEPMPVYYEKVGSIYYISPACISQEVFSRSLETIIGSFSPCKNSKALCKACELFGMVGEGSESGAVSSRVSFRDAIPVTALSSVGATEQTDWSNWYADERTIAILGGPNITATEFYMAEIPGADFYNYDYKVTHTEYTENNGYLKWTQQQKTALNDNEVRVRGRKYYWHSTNQKYANLQTDKPNQSATIRAVRQSVAGQHEIKFKFDVAFENITPEELSALIWVLTIGDDPDRLTHAHKLGHGKPIGFGSVRIAIDSSEVFKIDRNLAIVSIPLPTLPSPGNTLLHKDEFERVTDWNDRPGNVQYPEGTIDGEPNIYSWFVLNREMPDAKPNRQAFKNVLPKVLDISQELPFYYRFGKPYQYEPKKPSPSNRSGNPLNPGPSPSNRNGNSPNPNPMPNNRNNQPPESIEERVDTWRQHTPQVATIGDAFRAAQKKAKEATQPETLRPTDNQKKRAFTHFRNKARRKSADPDHLAILRTVPPDDKDYREAQRIILKFGG